MTKRCVLAIALFCGLGLSVRGQNLSTFGNITAGVAGCNAANCVYYQLPPGTPWVVINVSGTWAGTINLVSITAPQANFSNLNQMSWSTLGTTSANGNWSIATAGATFVLMQASAWSSGTAQVTMASSMTGAPLNNPVFPGTVTANGMTAPNGGSSTQAWCTNGSHGTCGSSGSGGGYAICPGTSGSGGVYACTTTPSVSLTVGTTILFQPDVTSLTNPVINVNAGGNLPLSTSYATPDYIPVEAGQLTVGNSYLFTLSYVNPPGTTEAWILTPPPPNNIVGNQTANTVYAGPASGSAAPPAWRSLALADIPSLTSLYCALSGCTLTGALTGTSAGFSSTVNASGYQVGGSPFGTANLADWTNASIANGDCPVWNSGTSKWTPGSCGGGSMVYPGAGIALSTGSAWGTSLTGTYGQMIDYNASNAAQAFTPTAQESPVLPQSAGNIPRFTRSVLSAGQNNLTCLGDSYMVLLGGSTWGICNNVANLTGYSIAHDYAISGYTACNINQSQVFQSISPTSSANTIYLLDGGINDYNLIDPGSGFVAPYDLQSQLVPYSANTQACEEANVAWLGTSLTSLQGTAPAPGGAWAADTRFGAVTGLKTSTSSATATWNITTTVNGQTIFLFYRVIQANSGNANFSVTVDGSTFLPTVSTDFPAPPLPAVSDASDYVGVRILKDLSLAAGAHTILVTTNSALAATDVIGIVGVTMVPPTITTSTPQVWAMGVPYLKNDANSRISAYYNRVVKKSVFDVTATGGESLSGTDSVSPGVAANFVDVRNCNFGTPPEMADNIHASTPTGWVEDATCFINPMPQTPIADYAPDNSWDNATRFGSVSGTGSCTGYYVPLQLSYTDNEVVLQNPVSCSGYSNVAYLPPPDYGVYQTLGGKRIKVKNVSGVPFQLLCSTTSAWNVCGGSAVGVVIPSGSVAIIDDATIESGTPGWNLESMEPGSSALHETVQISTSTVLSPTTDYVFVPSGTSGDITLTLPGGGGSSELLSPLFATTITVYNDGTHNVLFSASAGNAGSIVLGPQQSGIFWNIVPGGTSFGYWYGGVLTPTAGGGSGTVNSGTSGQVAYYAASGTAVSGETLVTAAQGGTGANNSSASGVSQWASGTQSVSTALVNGTTATTQGAGSNDTKLATDAYVDGHYIANGTSAMGTSAIASGACATTVTTSATGVAATDVIVYTPNVNPQGVTGYAVSASGSLYIWAYPTANDVNFEVCNNTASSITPAALTLNWKVTR